MNTLTVTTELEKQVFQWLKELTEHERDVIIQMLEEAKKEGIDEGLTTAPDLLRQRNELLEALEECKDALTHLYNFGQPAIIGKTGWEDFTNTFLNAAEHAQIAINNCKKDDQ